MRILFVDSTDTLRAPLAAACFMQRCLSAGTAGLEADSRGVRATTGSAPRPEAVAFARARSFTIKTTGAARLDTASLQGARLIVLMEEEQRLAIEAIAPELAAGCRLLSEFGAQGGRGPLPVGIPAADPIEPQRLARLAARIVDAVAGLHEEITLPLEEVYLREIEARVRTLRDSPPLLSPREVDLLEKWWRRGIPLWLVLESLEAAFRRKAGTRPRSLLYCAKDVDERAAALGHASLGGEDPPGRTRAAGTARTGAPGTAAPGAATGPIEALVQQVRSAGFPRTAELLARHAARGGPADLDEMTASLHEEASPDLLERLRTDAEERLAGHRERMTARAWETTIVRHIGRALRERAGI